MEFNSAWKYNVDAATFLIKWSEIWSFFEPDLSALMVLGVFDRTYLFIRVKTLFLISTYKMPGHEKHQKTNLSSFELRKECNKKKTWKLLQFFSSKYFTTKLLYPKCKGSPIALCLDWKIWFVFVTWKMLAKMVIRNDQTWVIRISDFFPF